MMLIHVLLTFSLLVLSMVLPSEQTRGRFKELSTFFRDSAIERCPRDLDQAAAVGRTCVKQCRSDHDCISKRKKCLCDGICGLSCIKPSFCGLPPKQPHAKHNAPADKLEMPLDTMVQYTCWSGYQAKGFPRAKCVYHNGTAQWFGPDLQCEPITCPDPGNIENGERNLTSLTFTSKVTYRCSPGYVMEGKAERYCQAIKKWSGIMPTCKAISCDNPFDPPNGRAIYTSVTYNSFVTYECQDRFKIVGDRTRVCGSDRLWTGRQPLCTEIDCGVLGHLSNGFYEARSTKLGAVVIFQCDVDARMMGNDQSVCLQNESWSNPLPLCLSSCRIPIIKNGKVNQTSLEIRNGKIADGEEIKIACDDRYELPNSNNDVITCRNGSFTQLTSCVPARCKRLPKRPKNGFVIAPKTDNGMKARYRCKDGYTLAGQNTTRCYYGNWTGSTPKCKIQYCSHPGNLLNGQVRLVGNLGFYEYRPYIMATANDRQIIYECNKGYRIGSGPTGATCLRGKWSPSNKPTCIPAKHPKFRWVRSVTDVEYREQQDIQLINVGSNVKAEKTCRGNLDEVQRLGRRCGKSCINDSDCRSKHRICICDGSCGLTCSRIGHCTHPGTPPSGAVYIVSNEMFNIYRTSVKYTPKGTKVYFDCFANYTLVGPKHAVCTENQWMPNQVPRCLPRKEYKSTIEVSSAIRDRRSTIGKNSCDTSFKVPKNGAVDVMELGEVIPFDALGEEKIEHGASLIFRCNSNFKMSTGPFATTCIDGIWSTDRVPTCLPIKEEVKFGRRTRAVDMRDERRKKRHKGLRRRAQNDQYDRRRRRKYRRNKKQNKNVRCSVLENTPTMKLFNSRRNQTKFFVGEVNVVCGGGYALNLSNNTVKCVQGKWHPKEPVCEPLKCKVPATDNGLYQKDGQSVDEGSPIDHDMSVEFVCLKGYIRHGMDNLQCWYGQWTTEEFPQCTPAACLLPDIVNGSYVDGYRGGLAVAHGSLLIYTCQEEFIHQTSDTLICHKGQLKPANPLCLPVDGSATYSSSVYASCTIPKLENGSFYRQDQELIEGQSVEHDGQVSLECRRGFVRDGDAVVKCAFGEWATNNFPSCATGPCVLPVVNNGRYIGGRTSETSIEYGTQVEYLCDEGYLPDTIGPLVCLDGGLLSPMPPQCTDSEGQAIIDAAPFVADISGKMAEESSNSTGGQIFGLSLGNFRRPCRAPYQVENTLFYKGEELISGDPTAHVYAHGIQVNYRCIIGITRERTTWTITCDDGTWIGTSKRCADDKLDMQNKSCEYRNSEPNLVAFDGDKQISDDLTELIAGSVLTFRCTDIGKFSMIGSVRRKCIDGEWDGIKPACFGLSQENDYALEKPPTILFRHQIGTTAQTNDGKLLVYPGTIVHLECLWMRKYGKPDWLVSHRHRKYPQNWASDIGRDENLEYRLSIYHAQQQDSGKFTCVTPKGHRHSVELIVKSIECPKIDRGETLMLSSPNNRLNAEVSFGCTSPSGEQRELTLQGPDKIKCLPSGNWSAQIPTCKAPECQIWNITSGNLRVETIRSMEGMRLVFRCLSGHILNGSSEIWCPKSNQWPMPFPTCLSPRCPQMKNVTVGNLMMNTETSDEGLKLSFTCKPGFVLHGRRQAICDSSGRWPQPYPTCHDVGCEKPQVPINGFIRGDEAVVHKAGDVVLFGCNRGYMMESRGVIACQDDGMWSASIPRCVKACTYPGVTDGGTISMVKFYYRIGENLKFDCTPGMKLRGPRMLKCLSSGLWSGAIPRCVAT